MRGLHAALVAVAMVLAAGPFASALTVSWDGGAGTSNWSDATNWSNDIVPTASTDVVIDDNAPASILTGANNSNARSITITKTSDFKIAKGAAGMFLNLSSNTPLIYNPGNASTFTFDSSLTYFWQATGFNNPVYEIDGQATFLFSGSTFVPINGAGAGTSMTKTGTGTMRFPGSDYMPVAINVSAGTMIDGMYSFSITKTNACLGPSTRGQTITVSVAPNATFKFDGNAAFMDTNAPINSGTTLANGILANFAGGGMVQLAGSNHTLTDCGASFSPGASDANGTGILSFQGNVTFGLVSTYVSCVNAGTAGKACSLNIDIAAGGIGMTPGVDFDQLAVSGTVTTINNCDLIVDGIGAVAGNSYTFLTSGNSLASAAFKSVTVNNTSLPYTVAPIGSGLGYQISFTPEPATMSLLVLGGLAMLKRKS